MHEADEKAPRQELALVRVTRELEADSRGDGVRRMLRLVGEENRENLGANSRERELRVRAGVGNSRDRKRTARSGESHTFVFEDSKSELAETLIPLGFVPISFVIPRHREFSEPCGNLPERCEIFDMFFRITVSDISR